MNLNVDGFQYYPGLAAQLAGNERNSNLSLDDFQYDLPEELIAQEPASKREDSRLMVVSRAKGEIYSSRFLDLIDWLPPRSLLVVNDVRVVPARLYGRRAGGGRIEAVLLEPPPDDAGAGVYEIECLTRPSKRLKLGERIEFGPGISAEVKVVGREGRRVLGFSFQNRPAEALAAQGIMPLPPYIKRDPEDSGRAALDRERYQTVYAQRPGAVAAPTAGLHFSSGLLEKMKNSGFGLAALTLFVGYGTFAPVRETDITLHRMFPERVVVPAKTAAEVNQAKAAGRPVAAVGTTVVRSLEHAGRKGGVMRPLDEQVDLFIYPGFEFKVTDCLITNFHLPGSTLLMLVSALAGRELIFEAYRRAVAEKFRFFSYGDAMLIL